MTTHHFTGQGYDFDADYPEGWRLITIAEFSKLNAAAIILSDLDRCEHGRHEGDVCSGTQGCNGPSSGNPFIKPGQRIGTTMSGVPIIVPGGHGVRTNLGDPLRWV